MRNVLLTLCLCLAACSEDCSGCGDSHAEDGGVDSGASHEDAGSDDSDAGK